MPEGEFRRIVIDAVRPSTPCAQYPAKAVIGGSTSISADIFRDGHDRLAARARWRPVGNGKWATAGMAHAGNDRWQAAIEPSELGLHEFVIEAWTDRVATWQHDVEVKHAAGQDLDLELEEGRRLIGERAAHAADADRPALLHAAQVVGDAAQMLDARLGAGLDPFISDLLSLVPDPADLTVSAAHELWVDRERALVGAWYELFPRSEGGLRAAIRRLAAVAEMGFDIVYLPPVHPVGVSHRKGRNNTLDPGPDDPGSPWAIGAVAGGHTAVEPSLGTIEDFDAFVAATHDLGMEVALDYALQCSPDHPWVTEHPEWFHHRPDGSIRYAENPPKKYQDIYPINFWPGHGVEGTQPGDGVEGTLPGHGVEGTLPGHGVQGTQPGHGVQGTQPGEPSVQGTQPGDGVEGTQPGEPSAREALWTACKEILDFWISHGVRIFRVDNPHTKPLAFWAWLIPAVQAEHPDVFFLAEAFTRPKVMAKLAEVGFSQSYTYFTWRTHKAELQEYLEEVCLGRKADFMRPNFWPNTPDILAGPLRNGPPSAFALRLVLAATAVPSYGIYSGYELGENEPASDTNEEYLYSEKYEIKHRDWAQPGSLAPLVADINAIRRAHPAFAELGGIHFHHSNNDQLLVFSRRTPDRSDVVLVVVNLDPHNAQSDTLRLDLDELGMPAHEPFLAHDELTGDTYTWQGQAPYVFLHPSRQPAHILHLRAP